MRNIIKILAAAAALSGAPAIAQQPAGTRFVVQTVDLDLASAEGRALLDRRIARAVREVCGRASDADPSGSAKTRDCRAATAKAASADRAIAIAGSDRRLRLAGSE